MQAPAMASGPIIPDNVGRACPRQHDRSSHEASHAKSNAAVEVLMEDEPREDRRRHAFEGQEQRSRRRIGMG